jgi:hypothetical protein
MILPLDRRSQTKIWRSLEEEAKISDGTVGRTDGRQRTALTTMEWYPSNFLTSLIPALNYQKKNKKQKTITTANNKS